MHSLFTKIGMDEVNKQLLDESQYPGADEEYNYPWFFKGTEPEEIKYAKVAVTPRSRGFSRRAPAKTVNPRELRTMLQRLEKIGQEIDRHPDRAMYFDCDWAALGDAINYLRSVVTGPPKHADLEIHEDPRFLPPRNDLRRHLDEDERQEARADSQDKPPVKMPPPLLSPEIPLRYWASQAAPVHPLFQSGK